MGMSLWIAWKELRGYFVTPVALVFLVAFGCLSVLSTFLWGDFFLLREASLRSYFYWLPFLWVMFVPAVGMRFWSEERRQQTLELLLTMPVRLWEVVLGKYLAGLACLGLGLAMSLPLAVTVCVLGEPDLGVMACGYVGGLLLGGALLAICSLLSALTSSQVIGYVSGAVMCLLLVVGGHQSSQQFLRQWLGGWLGGLLGWLSMTRRLETFQSGVLDVGDSCYLLSLVVLFLHLTAAALDGRRESR